MGQNNSTFAKPPGSTTGNPENQPPRRLGERFGFLARNRAGPGAAHENVPPADFVAAVAPSAVAAHGSNLAPVVAATDSIFGPAPVLAAAPMSGSASVPVAASGSTAVTVPVAVAAARVPVAVDNMNTPVVVAAPGSNASPLPVAEVEAPVSVVNYLNPTTPVPASGSVASLGPVLSLSSGIPSSVPASGNVPTSVLVRVPVFAPAPHNTSAIAPAVSGSAALPSARQQTAPGPEPSDIDNASPVDAASGRTSFMPAFAFGRLESTDNTMSAAAASGDELNDIASARAASGSVSPVSLVSTAASGSISPPGVASSVAACGSPAPARPGITTSAVVAGFSVAPEGEFLHSDQPGTPLAALSAGEATPSPSRVQPSRRAKHVAPGSYRITPFRQRDRRGKRAAREGEEVEMATPPSSSGSFAEKRKRDEIEEARPFKRRVSERLIRKSISEGSWKK